MAAPMVSWLLPLFLLLSLFSCLGQPQRKFTERELRSYRERVVRMFDHAYTGYLKYAYPYDELRPLSCDGHDTWGSYSLTLIDALDTLAIMGNYTEFERVVKLLIGSIDFDQDINVSVFETNIRVVGGLISAHLMTKRAGLELEPGWPCSGPLLRLAENVARRLLKAFDTYTGMPYGTVNLRYGVPDGETTVTCTAGVGTFIVEFGALTRLTGDPIFEKRAVRALKALWNLRSPIGLVGNHIDVVSGKWTALDSGVGAGVDSYLEYLVKGSILFQYPDLMEMFKDYLSSVETYLKKEDWYMWAHMQKGGVTLPVFQSLEAYWPGLQSLVGDIDKGMKTLHNFHQVWRQYGFTPEFYNIPKSEAQSSREGYPLRPELIESTMYLYQATKDPYLLEVGVDILESIEHSTKTKCGYATVKDVRTHELENRMESFFLAETTKYLYLLFTPDHWIHNNGGKGKVINTTNGECIIDAGGYVFNTEAHPVDAAALYCCSAEKKKHDQMLQEFEDNVDLLSLLDLVDTKNDMFSTKKQKRKEKSAKKQDRTKLSKNSDADQLGCGSGQTQEKSSAESVPVDSDKSISESEVTKGKTQEFMDLIKVDKSKLKVAKPVQEVNKPASDVSHDVEAQDKHENTVDTNSDESSSTKRPTSTTDEEATLSGTNNNSGNEADNLQDLHTSPGRTDTEKPTSQTGPQEDVNDISPEEDRGVDDGEPVLDTSTEGEQEWLEADTCRPSDREKEEALAEMMDSEGDGEDISKKRQRQRAMLFTCPAQPFYSRLSVMGEMFLND